LKKLHDIIKKILVADNDIFFAKFVENYFNEKGLNVEIALNGKEAIEKLLEKQFDLIIVDLVLPKISGKDVILYINRKCRRVYEEDQIKIILPIVVLTSSAFIEQAEKLSTLNVDFVLPKGPMENLLEAMDLMIYSELSSLNSKQNELLFEGSIFPREATQDLLLELEFFEGLFEKLPMGVIVLDRDTRIIRTNKKGVDILSLPKEDMLGREVFDVLPKEILPKLKPAMKKVLTSKENDLSIVNGDLSTPFSQIWVSLLRQESFVGWLMIFLPW